MASTFVTTAQGMSLAEVQKAHDPSGQKYKIFDAVRRRAMVFDNMVWKPANMPDKHMIVRRTANSVIAPQLGRINKGVLPTSLKAEQAFEYMCMVEDRSIVDVRMKEFFPDINSYREDMDLLKLKDVTADSATRMFYGARSTNADDIDGLATRLNATTVIKTVQKVATAPAADGAASSVYFVNWDKDRVHGIYPAGSDVGAQIKELSCGPMGNRVVDADGGAFQAYESGISHRLGLAVIDPLSIGRLANINASAVDPFFATSSAFNLVNYIRTAMQASSGIHAYLSEKLYTALLNGLQGKNNFNYSRERDDFGREIIDFAGIIWHVCDQLVDTEKVIV